MRPSNIQVQTIKCRQQRQLNNIHFISSFETCSQFNQQTWSSESFCFSFLLGYKHNTHTHHMPHLLHPRVRFCFSMRFEWKVKIMCMQRNTSREEENHISKQQQQQQKLLTCGKCKNILIFHTKNGKSKNNNNNNKNLSALCGVVK